MAQQTEQEWDVCKNTTSDTSANFLASLLASEKTTGSTSEEDAQKLFDCYCANSSKQLQANEMRKLLFDLLEGCQWPLVVTDEALDGVLGEIKFKAFFVFLHDKPLHKLLQLVTEGFSKEELGHARLVYIDLTEEGVDNPPSERSLFQKVKFFFFLYVLKKKNYLFLKKKKGTTRVYVHFASARNIVALAMGRYKTPLLEQKTEEVRIGIYQYNVRVKGFAVASDMFPPIERRCGMTSKIAYRLADTYVTTKEWDQQHFNIVDKTNQLSRVTKEKWQEFDGKYKVQNKLDATAKSTTDALRAFDEKHEITNRLNETARSWKEKYDKNTKLNSQVEKIKNNENVQKVSSTMSNMFKSGLTAINQISKETKQVLLCVCLLMKDNRGRGGTHTQDQSTLALFSIDNIPPFFVSHSKKMKKKKKRILAVRIFQMKEARQIERLFSLLIHVHFK
ncbi:hypothetical protein RFI_20589 [Reticulomyxa filosa]|uniref:Uncharacterized protein n=1 Tax=Reticulomyxa filosa TaxID=46433 RepID=X6MRX0_RETFI|nr:hypothetical protein RFI_20589 [Reticulomyxa filosa]|eukprot:ETO16753.1 hypothetical protein RFI_20589 [Reticulomyxa filosa]